MSAVERRGQIHKKRVEELLLDPDFAVKTHLWRSFPARKVINPLLSFLCATDETLRWHAVTAAGIVTASLAEKEPESARVIVRRFLWQVNEESGGIGWGIPEALGESLARSRMLAQEYGRLLLAFVREDENYLEHPPLLAGALWGLARVVNAHPDLLKESALDFSAYADHPTPLFRALALWGLTAVGDASSFARLEVLATDTTPVRLYRDECFHPTTVAALAQEARCAIRARAGVSSSPGAA